MRVIITGIGGFVGRHLTRYLVQAQPDAEISGIELTTARPVPGATLYQANLLDPDAVADVIERVKPNIVYHLAAQASPRVSFQRPWETLETNIRAQLNVFLACLRLEHAPRLMVVSSAEVYGIVRPEQMPLHEDMPLRPASPYGVSKVAQDLLGLQYYLSHHIPIIRVRPFNHFGPGQGEGFVATDFALQIARIEQGQQPPVLRVGNLAAERDFTDVRDVVRAYSLLMQQGEAGEVYHVASGVSYTIQTLLDTLLSLSSTPIQVEVDPLKMMPLDIPVIRGDASKLRKATGWQPEIVFKQTLHDLMEDCRERVAQSLGKRHD